MNEEPLLLSRPQIRLATLAFSDLFLSTDPQDPILALNLSGPGVDPSGLPGAPKTLPVTARADARRLLEAVEHRWAAERFVPEFAVSYDDIAYRCSRIAPPDTVAREPRESLRATETRNWCLRRIDRTHLSIETLGMPRWTSAELVRIGASSGLLLVAGSFGSGKSTTAAACFKSWIDTHGGIGVTLEDPPEKPLDGAHDGGQIYQVPVRDSAFPEAIKSSRRWAYRYLLLGETRDQATANELLQIGLAGPMVMTTIHASGPVEALMALSGFAAVRENPAVVNDRIAACISGVLWQTLVSGRIDIQYLSFRGRNAASMRTKISDGRYRLLKEDLFYQSNLRGLGRIEESF